MSIFLHTFFLSLLFAQLSFAQIQDKLLGNNELHALLTKRKLQKLDIKSPIQKAYKYSDASGQHLLLFSAEQRACEEQSENCTRRIQAFCLTKRKNEDYKLNWKMNDFILEINHEVSREHTIDFWEQYCSIEDFDGDGKAEVLLVYASQGINGLDDGRIKLLFYNEDKKRAIRHQNSSLDFQRATQIDKGFYKLPQALQERARAILEEMEAQGQAIFPNNWRLALKAEHTLIKN